MAPMPALAPRSLTAPEKVATILMTMGQSAAGRVMKHMAPADLRTVTQVMAELKPVAVPQIESLVDEFVTEFGGGTSLVGDASQVHKLLSGFLPEDQIADIIAEMEGRAGQSIWDLLSNVPEATLTAYVKNEHPQTIALIASRLPPGKSAKLMSGLSTELRDAVTRRMLSCKPVAEEAVGIIESTLHEDFMLNVTRNKGGDAHARMAEIINKMEPDQMEALLAGLTETDPKSAEILRSLMFTFDDVVKLNQKSLQALFDAVENDKLTLALKGTTESFRDTVLSCLASRTRRMVEQELATGEPATQRQVNEARRTITDLALAMAQRGEIELARGDEDSALVQ